MSFDSTDKLDLYIISLSGLASGITSKSPVVNLSGIL
nr:MAG TPA: hypothetical protein [Bacteriophage sp.]